jgi:hypothetical protein
MPGTLPPRSTVSWQLLPLLRRQPPLRQKSKPEHSTRTRSPTTYGRCMTSTARVISLARVIIRNRTRRRVQRKFTRGICRKFATRTTTMCATSTLGDSGQIYPQTIYYTGNGTADGIFKISFSTSTRPDPYVSYKPLFKVTTNYRISNCCYERDDSARVRSLVHGR